MLFSTHFLRFLLKKYRWMHLPFWRLFLRVLVIIVSISLVINAASSLYILYVVELYSFEEYSLPVYFIYVFQTTIYFSLWFGIYFGVYYFRNYKKEEIEKWKLESSLKDAELIALKAQINPHFLFNALNNIRALILEDQMKARDMVSHLSELLRYSIQFSENEKVNVAEEMEIVEKYLALESTHYEDRLNFEMVVSRGAEKFKIPPMAIQLLVENAVKHGISQLKEGGRILVSVHIDESLLAIEVLNTGNLNDSEMSGIGIKNATDRIRILFDKEPEFALTQEGEMVKSVLKLPAEK